MTVQGTSSSAIPLPRRSAVEQALHQLVRCSDARLDAMLVIPAQFARNCLRVDSIELARWSPSGFSVLARIGATYGELEASLVGRRSLAQHSGWVSLRAGAAPPEEGESAADREPELREFADQQSLLQLPLQVDGHYWGHMRLWRARSSFTPDDLDLAFAVLHDVAGMVSAAERLQRMARQALEDPLTGLSNRRAFTEALSTALHPPGAGVTIIISDINRLKYVNDRYGHLAGDRAIIDTATALATAAETTRPGELHRKSVLVARIGGDEFAVLLPGADRAAAIALVTEATRLLAESRFDITMSSGIVVAPVGFNATQALALADEAQYAAKSRGALLIVAATAAKVDTAPKIVPPADKTPRVTAPITPTSTENSPSAIESIVTEVARRLQESPLGIGPTLRWLGERLLLPFGLSEWAVSQVNLAGDRLICTDSMGINGSVVGPERYDDQVDINFPIDDYPLTRAAIVHNGWFAAHRGDPHCDPAERSVLDVMGMTHMVALGCNIADQGWLLELYSRGCQQNQKALGEVSSVALSALLGQPFRELSSQYPLGTSPE
jgi:diguanylate cyclase (GGDEF)-like protein